jgi:hypothetical protein
MITSDLLVQAVQAIDRRAKFCFADADINTIEWLEGYTPIPLSQIQVELDRLITEQPLVELRAKRNKLLTETDYLALSDVTMSDDMAAYRQALRDLPANTEDPANPVWPTKPS